MRDTISKLDAILNRRNPELTTYLKEGAGSIDVISLFKALSIDIVSFDDLYYLYTWHDGTILDESKHCLNHCLFPDYYLMSIKQIETQIETDYFYNFKGKRLLPIFASCGEDFLVINIDEYNSKNGYKIYYCSPRITSEKGCLSM